MPITPVPLLFAAGNMECQAKTVAVDLREEAVPARAAQRYCFVLGAGPIMNARFGTKV